MTLDVSAALRAPGTALPFTHKEELPSQEIMGETVEFPEPAVVEGTFSLQDDSLVISAKLTAKAHAHCARCLVPVVYPVEVPFIESFLREDPRDQTEDDPWEERLVFTGHKVELGPLVQSLTLLDLPMRFLCKKACQQLPGTEEVQEQGQDKPDDNHPFAALKQLLNNFQEE